MKGLLDAVEEASEKNAKCSETVSAPKEHRETQPSSTRPNADLLNAVGASGCYVQDGPKLRLRMRLRMGRDDSPSMPAVAGMGEMDTVQR